LIKTRLLPFSMKPFLQPGFGFRVTFSNTVQVNLWHFFERLLQIGQNVIDVLNTYRKPDEIWRDACCQLLVR
jgi:hypothetical protein